MLALVGIPLGIATRKGGKSAGYVIGLFLAFFCYYLASISLIGLAKQRTLPVPVASGCPTRSSAWRASYSWRAWSCPGIATCSAACRPGRRGFERCKPEGAPEPLALRRHGGCRCCRRLSIPTSSSSFLFYLLVVLASFVSMTLVYNFFDLMGDMVRNKIPLTKMFTYLFFLTPQLIY